MSACGLGQVIAECISRVSVTAVVPNGISSGAGDAHHHERCSLEIGDAQVWGMARTGTLIAHVWAWPHVTVVMTSGGARSCPSLSLPQQTTRPVPAATAHECRPPAHTDLNRPCGAAARLSAWLPQHTTSPTPSPPRTCGPAAAAASPDRFASQTARPPDRCGTQPSGVGGVQRAQAWAVPTETAK
jgi:hypothetical protein